MTCPGTHTRDAIKYETPKADFLGVSRLTHRFLLHNYVPIVFLAQQDSEGTEGDNVHTQQVRQGDRQGVCDINKQGMLNILSLCGDNGSLVFVRFACVLNLCFDRAAFDSSPSS